MLLTATYLDVTGCKGRQRYLSEAVYSLTPQD